MDQFKYQEKDIDKSFDIQIVKRLFKYLKPQLPLFMLCIVLIVFITAADLSTPYFIKIAIDDSIVAYNTPMVVTDKKVNDKSIFYKENYYTRQTKVDGQYNNYKTLLKNEGNYYLVDGKRSENYNQFQKDDLLSEKEYQIFRQQDKRNLLFLSGILIAILIMKLVFSFLNMYALSYGSQKIIYSMREDLFSHLQRLPLEFFDRNPTGRLVTRVTNDMKRISELFTNVLVTSLKDLFLIVGTVIVMLSMNFRLAVVSLLTVPIVILISYLFRVKARKIQRKVKKRLAVINATLAENISGMKIIQMFNKENVMFEKFRKINEKYLQSSIRETKLFAIFKPSMNVMYSLSVALIIYYGGGLAIKEAIEIGVIVAFIQYINQFFRPIFDLAEKFNIFQSAMASSERVFLLFDETNGLSEIKEPKEFDESFEGRIKFDNVSFAYDEEYVLKNINFEAKKGQTVALVGATGSGKTTITRLINRFYDIDKGKITIDDIDIRNLRKTDLRRKIGMVLQDVFLFAEDIETNIRLNDKSISKEKIRQVSEYVNSSEFIEKLPDKYESKVTEGGSTLSTGQRQLISFARALAFDPKVLILDEATSNIDTHTEILIQDAIEKLIKDRTTIIVAHRLSTIQNADKIIVLHDGKIVESGTHENLISQEGMYYDLYKLQYVE